jgi:hypothetical protein
MAVQRHKEEHLPAALAKARSAAEADHGDDLLRQVRVLQMQTLNILKTALGAQDLNTALRAISEARRNLELLARLNGELEQGATVNLVISPQWLEVRAAILAALAPYPNAKLAVAERLSALEVPNGHEH